MCATAVTVDHILWNTFISTLYFLEYLNAVITALLMWLKAKLMPSDDITVFYKTDGILARIIPDYYDFIFATIKQPLQPFTGSPPSGSGIAVIVSDSAKVILSVFLPILDFVVSK